MEKTITYESWAPEDEDPAKTLSLIRRHCTGYPLPETETGIFGRKTRRIKITHTIEFE